MFLTVTMGGICKVATVLSVLMKAYTIPCHDRGHINVMVVLQSCTDSLQVLPGSSSETFPTSSDCTYGVGGMKAEEEVDLKEEEEVNVKREKVLDIEEEECIDIKEEYCIYNEVEKGEEEEEDVEIKEEVSCEDTV